MKKLIKILCMVFLSLPLLLVMSAAILNAEIEQWTGEGGRD